MLIPHLHVKKLQQWYMVLSSSTTYRQMCSKSYTIALHSPRQNLSSPSVLSVFRVSRSSVFCLMFCWSLLPFCPCGTSCYIYTHYRHCGKFKYDNCFHGSFRVYDCCLTSNEQFFSYIMAKTNCIRWDPLRTRPTPLVGLILIVLTLRG